jgi:hypothetical protein
MHWETRKVARGWGLWIALSLGTLLATGWLHDAGGDLESGQNLDSRRFAVPPPAPLEPPRIVFPALEQDDYRGYPWIEENE